MPEKKSQGSRSSNAGSGFNFSALRALVIVAIPVVAFVSALLQGKGCNEAWDSANVAILSILTHQPPPDHSNTETPVFPHALRQVSPPLRDTVFAVGDRVRASREITAEGEIHVPAGSVGTISAIADERPSEQYYIVKWDVPSDQASMGVAEDDLLAADDGSTDQAANSAYRASTWFRATDHLRDNHRSFLWCRRAAALGHSAAMADLAWMYNSGTGVPSDAATAVTWYRRAADAGNAWGMDELGMMLRDGKGTSQDDAEATKWFRRSAEAGDAGGMDNLGWMIQNGRGAARDDADAVDWFRKAAAAQSAWGMFHLACCLHTGNGIAQNEADAVGWLNKAAALNHPAAMASLAEHYANGWGLAADDATALVWYRKAAALGDAAAQAALRARGLDWQHP